MADFILNLPGHLFDDTFAFQVGIVRHLPRLFIDLALPFVDLACDFILNAWLHLAESCAEIRMAAGGENIRELITRRCADTCSCTGDMAQHHIRLKEDWGMSRFGHFQRLISHSLSGTREATRASGRRFYRV